MNQIANLTVPEYNALPAQRASVLKHLCVSPLHYQHALNRAHDDGGTEAMVFGSAVHCALFEPARFRETYGVYPGPVRRGKEWDLWVATHRGCTSIPAGQMRQVEQCVAALKRHPWLAKMLGESTGRPEMSVLWPDEASGMQCKARVDWLDAGFDSPLVLGLKTARDVAKRRFEAHAVNLDYPFQWGMYATGVRQVTGKKPTVVEVVVENHAPWDILVLKIPDEVVESASQRFHATVCAARDLEDATVFPGQHPDPETFELPRWAPDADVEDPEIMVGDEMGGG